MRENLTVMNLEGSGSQGSTRAARWKTTEQSEKAERREEKSVMSPYTISVEGGSAERLLVGLTMTLTE